MEEIWKDIEGFEGYQVSNLGNVRSLDRIVVNSLGHNCHYKGRYMSKHKDTKGYLRASIGSKDNLKLRPIHRLVALAFIDNPDNKPEVITLNGQPRRKIIIGEQELNELAKP